MKNHKRFLLLSTMMLLSACAATPEARHATAARIGSAAGLTERTVEAGSFNLTTWQRLSVPGAPVDVYIEGDGLAWLDKYTVSPDPTPPDPVALRLAAADTAPNVVYLARPCQYSGMKGQADKSACAETYWTTGVTASEVIAAYQQALDALKSSAHISGFHLIGFSGGAGVAALVAAERTDVLSLRTVAGNTDYAVFTAVHHVSALRDSQDPVSVAARLVHLPQRHFIGGEDKIVPEAVFDGWKQASGVSTCVQSTVVPEASHEKGWAAVWPELLKMSASCVQ